MARREPAAVRAAVIASPSISATGVPVAASKTTIAAWWAGSWPGKSETSLAVTDAASWACAPISRTRAAAGHLDAGARRHRGAAGAERGERVGQRVDERVEVQRALDVGAAEDAQPHSPAPQVSGSRKPCRERVVGVEHELVDAGDPGAARRSRARSPRCRRRSCGQAMRPTSRVPITLSLTNSSPSSISPRAASTASRAEVAVPVAQRSRRPGATTVALRASPPSRGAAVKTAKERTPSAGSAGWAISSCSATAGRMRSPRSASSRASSGHDRVAERLGVDEGAERAAVGDVDPQLADPRDLRPARRGGSRTTARSRT